MSYDFEMSKRIKEEWKIPDNKLFDWSLGTTEFEPEYEISEKNAQKMYYILKSFNDNCSLSCKQCSLAKSNIGHPICIFGVINQVINNIESKGMVGTNG